MLVNVIMVIQFKMNALPTQLHRHRLVVTELSLTLEYLLIKQCILFMLCDLFWHHLFTLQLKFRQKKEFYLYSFSDPT